MNEERLIRLILNGKSSGNEAVREAVKTLRDEGQRVEVRVTWEFGDAARYAREAVKDRVDVVVAGGGDGSVNEVSSGLLESGQGSDVGLAILPLGTANDFATSCGIPIGDPLAALRLAAEGQDFAIDAGIVNGRHFVNVASGGIGAEVTTNTPPKLKKAMGGAAYALVGIATAPTMTPSRCKVRLRDGSEHSGDLFVLGVGNGRQCGGGKQLTPLAFLNDGLLDLMVIHDLGLGSFGTLINEWITLADPSNQHVSYIQLQSFTIEAETPMQVNLDGEPLKSERFEFSALPGALRLVCPADNPLLKR